MTSVLIIKKFLSLEVQAGTGWKKNNTLPLSLHLLASGEENYKKKHHSKQPVADPRFEPGTSQILKQSDIHCATTFGVLITRSGTEGHTIVRIRTLKALKMGRGKNGKCVK
jgi:hypothetical protein